MADKRIKFTTDKSGNEYFVVTFDYDPQLVEFVKKIPTRKYVSKSWRIRADHHTAKYVEAFARKLDFILDVPSAEYINKMMEPVSDEIKIPTLKRDLRDFQKTGVNYITRYERCFLADEMGLGKSGQAIAAVEALDAYPCLIICPASVKIAWKKEISKWLDKDVNVIEGFVKINYEDIEFGGTKKRIVVDYDTPNYDGDFVIINYDILNRERKLRNAENPNDVTIPDHKDLLKKIGFNSIILDESHYLINHKSLRN